MIQDMLKMIRVIGPSNMRRLTAFFGPHLSAHRAKLITAFFLSALSMVFLMIQPWPIKLLIDYVLIGEKHYKGLLPFYDVITADKFMAVTLISAAILLLAIGQGITEYFQTILIKHVGQRIVVDMRVRLFERIQKLSLAFHTRSRSGDVLMRITGDINLLRDLFTDILISLITNTFVVVAVVALMLVIDWKMTLLVFSVFPLILAVSMVTGVRIREAAQRQRRKESEVSVLAHEALIGMPIIQAYSREDSAQDALKKRTVSSFKDGLRAARLEALASQWTGIILALGTVIVVIVGSQSILADPPTRTPGDLLLYYFYLRILSRPIRSSARTVSRAAKAAASAERVMEIMRLKPDIADRPGAIEAPDFHRSLEFRDVSFAYEDLPVLQNLNLKIEVGEKIAIVGASGSGKSTLCSLIPRFYDPTQGQVLFDGNDLRSFDLKSVRAQVGIVLQETLLFGASVFENIAFGKPDATLEQVEKAARRAQANRFIEHLPDGYDTVIAERGLSLSQGQKQRIALARCFLRNAKILILDEPTSNVDARSERLIIKAIRKLLRDTTCIIITHNTRLLDFVDRVVVLDHGKIAEIGTPGDLDAKGGLYGQLRSIQLAGDRDRTVAEDSRP